MPTFREHYSSLHQGKKQSDQDTMEAMDQDTETTQKPLGISKENTRGSLKDILNYIYNER